MIRRLLRLVRPPPPPPPAPAPEPPPPPDPRQLAQEARERGALDEAARHYRAHLERQPDDAGILVQLGHLLKDGGDPAAAERCYRDAMALQPRDHDIPLQLGHALKLQDRLREAAEAYALADALTPVNHAAAELAGLAQRTRDQGQAARERGDLDGAARHFRAHLEQHPGDAGTLVQLGHVLKDAGDPAAAERCYRDAMALRPEEHDIPLQLGHALKLQGRLEEAAEAYALADALAPVNHAAIELAGLGQRPRHPLGPRARARAPQPDAEALREAFLLHPERRAWLRLRAAGGEAEAEGIPGGPILLDVTDLLAMLRQTGRATGIQRVQLALCRHMLDHAPGEARFVALDGALGPLWALREEDLDAILRHATEEAHDHRRAAALVEAAMGRARVPHLPSARLFLTLGAFWFLAGGAPLLDRLRARGIRLGMLAFDLIPLTHPQHTDAATVAGFRRALDEGAGRWDLVLAISAHSAAGMRRALAERGAADVPVVPVPLAHRFDEAAPGPWPEAVADLRDRPFVLCVGTLESRKNHLALFQAWLLLLEEGREPPPMLWVGRPGWRVADLMAQLEATGFLGGRIRLLHGISDPELAALYAGAAFTLFPSFTEGWGLPVGESLALGTPVLAAMTGAIPEAAEGFAGPLDPFSPRQIAEAVRRWCDDPAALQAERARIREGFVPRRWGAVGEAFRLALREALEAPPLPRPDPPRPVLAPGAPPALPDAVLGAGFAPAEGGVAWVLGPAATLHLEAPPGLIQLVLAARPWAEGNTASVGGAAVPLRDGATLAHPWPGGAGTLTLHVAGPLEVPEGAADGRPVRGGLRTLRLLPPEPPALPPRALGPEDAAEWALLCPGDGTLRFRAEGPVHLLLGLEGEAAPRRLRLEPAADGGIALPLPGRPVLLRWAAAEDLPGRLALLEEADPPAGSLEERLAALEGRPAAAPPPPAGEAGRWARRLGPR